MSHNGWVSRIWLLKARGLAPDDANMRARVLRDAGRGVNVQQQIRMGRTPTVQTIMSLSRSPACRVSWQHWRPSNSVTRMRQSLGPVQSTRSIKSHPAPGGRHHHKVRVQVVGADKGSEVGFPLFLVSCSMAA